MKNMKLFSLIPLLLLGLLGYYFNASSIAPEPGEKAYHRSCTANCFWGSCSVTCLDSETPVCKCTWGHAYCTCEKPPHEQKVSSSTPTLTQTPEQRQRSIEFENYLNDTGASDAQGIAIEMKLIREAIDTKDANKYHASLKNFSSKLQNLSLSTKSKVNSYFAKRGIDSIP